MAVEVHGLTYQNVLDDVGGADVRRVSATSDHINHAMITAWIKRGAGKVNGIVAAEGLTVSTDAAIEAWSMGVLAYAKSRFYERLNRWEAVAVMREEYKDALRDLRALSDEIDGGLSDADRVKSNIDTLDPKRRKFVSYNSTRADGFEGW